MAKCTPPARGDLSLTRLLADLYRPASIFQATSFLIFPFINVLGEEKFSTSCFVETRNIIHPWKLTLSVSELMFNVYIFRCVVFTYVEYVYLCTNLCKPCKTHSLPDLVSKINLVLFSSLSLKNDRGNGKSSTREY